MQCAPAVPLQISQAVSKDSEEDPDEEAARRNDKKRKSDERVGWIRCLRLLSNGSGGHVTIQSGCDAVHSCRLAAGKTVFSHHVCLDDSAASHLEGLCFAAEER